MRKHFDYDTGGRVCARAISFDYEDGVVKNIVFDRGCPGNTTGVARLAEGRTPEELIGMLKGVECRGPSSCPNEFACALEEMLEVLNEDGQGA